MAARAGATLFITFSVAIASASPIEDPMLAGSAVFTGPTTPHATSIVINPAALGRAPRGQHLVFLSSTRLSQLSVEREIVQADGSSTSAPSASATTLSPGGLVAFDFAIGDRYRLGVAFSSPLAHRWPTGQDPYRFHSNGGHSYQFTGNVSGSFAAHSRILFGFGVSLGYSLLGLDFARDTALEAGTAGVESDCEGMPCGIENPAAEESYRIRTKTRSFGQLFAPKNLGFVGGTMIRVTKSWWLALSLVLPSGSVSGTLDLAGDVEVQRATRDGGGSLRGDAEIAFDNPVSVYLGARGPLTEELSLLAHLRWQNLSVRNRYDLRMFGGNLESGDVPEWYPRHTGYADVFTLAVGVESPEVKRFRYGGRLIMETGAVDAKEISPAQPATWHATASGGLEFRLTDHWVLGGGYALSIFPPTTATDSDFNPLDRLNCIDQDFDLQACEAAREGRALPSANGSYTHFEHSLQLTLRYDTL